MGLISTEAIVIRTYNLADADKIVVCLTQNFGVVRAAARGARRVKSRFGASLEPFTIASITYYEKEGRELVSLREVEIIHSSFGLTKSTEAVAGLAYMGELIMEFSPPHEPNEKIFRMARAVLLSLTKTPEQVTKLLRYFEIWILKLSGFLPDQKTCSICGVQLLKESGAYSTSDLKVFCGDCTDFQIKYLPRAVYLFVRSALNSSPEIFVEEIGQSLTSEQSRELGFTTQGIIRRSIERKPRITPTN